MEVRVADVPTPFATVEIDLPHSLTVAKANGVTSFSTSVDGTNRVLVRLKSSQTFSLEGTGFWDRSSAAATPQPAFRCHNLIKPNSAISCTSLGAHLKIASLWDSGYMMQLLVSRWQAGGELNLQLDLDSTRNVYLERVEVDGASAAAAARWHHSVDTEFHHAGARAPPPIHTTPLTSRAHTRHVDTRWVWACTRGAPLICRRDRSRP